MVGITYTPPLLPTLAAAIGPAGASPVVANVISALGPGAVQDSLSESLQTASGPGNIITGTVISATPGGSLSLSTATGMEIALHLPPEVPIAQGSTVTLRVTTTGTTPQAILLAVDGKPVVQRTGPGGGQAGSGAANATPNSSASTATTAPVATAMPGIGSASAYAASLAAVISLEDEAAIETALNQSGGAGSATASPPGETIAETLLAVLVRPAPARPGQTPLAAGTRYLVTLRTAPDDSPTQTAATLPSTTLPAAAPSSIAAPQRPPMAPPDPSSLPATDEPAASAPSDFVPQTAVLAGRVSSSEAGDTQIETPLGTIAVPLAEPLPQGMAIRLYIAAVAPPASPPMAETLAAAPQGLMEAVMAVLARDAPALADQARATLLPPGNGLLAALVAFIANPRSAERARDLATTIKQALADASRADLETRFAAVTERMGDVQPMQSPDGWTIVTLPFFGTMGEQPVRLYTKKSGDEEDDAKGERRSPDQRIVIEVMLRQLGPLQFDGLVRTRRFDLVLRTETPIDPELQGVVETAFHGAVASCGWGGDIAFGRTGKFPLTDAVEDRPAGALDVGV